MSGIDRPLCFVVMPFGTKPDPSGGPPIDFDRIYQAALEPGIRGAGMEPIRADREELVGVIHEQMFERLLLCDFAVADLTGANANVFYELGIRHAARPHTTLPVFASRQRIPFDVNLVRCLLYDLDCHNALTDEHAEQLIAAVTTRLRAMADAVAAHDIADSPVFRLVDGYRGPPLDHLKTDTFREQIDSREERRVTVADAVRDSDPTALAELAGSLDYRENAQAGVFIDLMFGWRALGRWAEMEQAIYDMPEHLEKQDMVQEQLAFALNRQGRGEEAAELLRSLVDQRGASPETLGLLGRVYKDQWAAARDRPFKARGFLRKAIDAYLAGFEADWRDAYPGINAVTLLEVEGSEASLERRGEILPVVRYAAKRGTRGRSPGYWDHATLLELAVLADDLDGAAEALSDAMASDHEEWMLASTVNNLQLIFEARRSRGAAQRWVEDLLQEMRTG